MPNYDVEYPEAYEAAIARNIRNNAAKTFFKTYPRANEVLDYLDQQVRERGNEFANSLLDTFEKYGKLSPKQMQAAERMIDNAAKRLAEYKAKEAANAVDVPEGRIEITGEVVSLKAQHGDYGVQHKALIKDDRGFKVWGSVPNAIIDDVEKGSRVKLTATVVQSNDKGFGFYKRPAKAEILK
jgi:hypothetical protein